MHKLHEWNFFIKSDFFFLLLFFSEIYQALNEKAKLNKSYTTAAPSLTFAVFLDGFGKSSLEFLDFFGKS